MKIIKTKRREFDPKPFRGGVVAPETEFNGDDKPTYRNEIAMGVVINNCWYERPDNIDGKYVLIERLHTNSYGCVVSGKTERELITQQCAYKIDKRVGRGIINQIATVQVSGDLATCQLETSCLVRKQGA